MRMFILVILLNCFSVFTQKPEKPVFDCIVKTDSSSFQEDFFSVAYTDPSFPGGIKEFYNFIKTNVVYPESFINQGLNGKVYARITIESDGRIVDIKIIRGMVGCVECDQEVVRLLELMPNWIPATHNGYAVKTVYSIPFTFRIH